MKDPQHIKSHFANRLWKASLVLAIALFSIQLWAGNETGWDFDLGFGKYNDAAILRSNLGVQSTMPLSVFRLGAEMRFPTFYSLAQDGSFLSIGILAGGRAGIRIWKVEPFVAVNLGPHALLYFSKEASLGFKFSSSLDYVLKYWLSDDEYAIYLNYNETYNLYRKTIGTFGIGMSFLSDL